MPTEVLDRRSLNRATLARQGLLERSDMSPVAMIEHLVGMQAQNPLDPYHALHARLDSFDPNVLADLIRGGGAVRAQLMRGTIHLVSADDFFNIHPVTADVLARVFASTQFSKDCAGIDMGELLGAGREILETAPMTRAGLAEALARRWPDHEAGSLAHAVTYLTPLVQVPPRGVWGESGPAAWALADVFLGERHGSGQALPDLVLRYLSAFGPAGVKDMRAWSRLNGLREVFEGLRPRLRVFHDENGAELFDLEDAPRPDADTAAPPRLLPEYDNLLLGHDDRSRFFDGELVPPGWVGSVLVDGTYVGTWRIGERKLEVRVTAGAMASAATIEAEASRMGAMIWPDGTGDASLSRIAT